jgi:peptide/nickel transport system substrate-binding protein
VKAEAPTATTLVVHYEKPVGNVLSQFQQFAILPKHIWSRYTGHNGRDLKTFPNAAPVVSGGPFVLKKFKREQTRRTISRASIGRFRSSRPTSARWAWS